MAKVLEVEQGVWEYSVGQHFGGVTTVALGDAQNKPIFYLEGDQRPPDGNHFEIYLVCVPDIKEEG